ncbi:MAG TPA: M23 family metallopeptidase [Chloroflexota bacterium]|nr:M23 family metallopeptidase [Chloroflexota bacterium]
MSYSRFYPLTLLLAGACAQRLAPVIEVVPQGAPGAITVTSAGSDIRLSADIATLRARALRLPVAGVSVDELQDTFAEPRDGGRQHNAIDILAPRGTPVLAADDGYVLRLSMNTAGGITVYATDKDERYVYYYAHLDAYHLRLVEGRRLAKGDTLGYVGTTGNAPKDIPHLHFQIMRMPLDGKYWNGEPINPFEVLHSSGVMTAR